MIETFTQVIFGLFCLLTIAGALYVLASDNLLYAAFGLLVSLLGVSGLFVFAGAEFVAVSQIMIYIGGILVLIIFGILLSNKKSNSNDKKGTLHVESQNKIFTMLLCVFLFMILLFFITSLSFNIRPGKDMHISHVKSLGLALMTDYVFILEAVAVLLLAALIGATYLSNSNRNE